ncbi:peptide deformylase [Streptomyces sp. NPDC007971]|uniref:peptide deformylase n=1 Tax=Streptomyces sp. NPDC007971 TaxID=3364799 RepID=UPI0036E65EE9
MPADDAPAVILLNPRITDRSEETDEQYEGCLSFFDVRGLVPRPAEDHGVGHHPGGRDHDHRVRTRPRPPHPPRNRPPRRPAVLRRNANRRRPDPVEEYRQTGRAWAYEYEARTE